MDTPFASDRRVFLKRLTLIAGGAFAAGGLSYCALQRSRPSGPLPFAVWREIREALRTSPDHLVAAADNLVKAGDLEEIFRFVRDAIATYPSATTGVNPAVGYRWGTRATLRGGAGTPREKADLLAELFRRAGAEAEVVLAYAPMDPIDVQREFWRSTERDFAPQISPDTLEAWRRTLGLPASTSFSLPRFDEDGAESFALAQEIRRQLPTRSPPPPPFDWRWRVGTPLVRVTKDGQTLHANLFKPNLALGDTGTTNTQLRPAPQPDALASVEIALSAAVSSEPSRRFELVRGTWTLDDLVGRQVFVQMLPGLDLRDQAAATFNDVRTFVPALAVQALDLDATAAAALSVLGEPVTRDGARLAFKDSGELLLDGREVAGSGSAAAAGRVASLEVIASATHAPLIQLKARAFDADGLPVEGIGASSFRVEEDGHPVSFLLRSNRAAPRIALLCDQSGSMPAPYRSRAMDALVANLTAALRAEHPFAEVKLHRTNSDLWTWLAKAAGSDANLIVYITDGHVEDELTETVRATLRLGPPVVLVDVGNLSEDHFWYKRTYVPMKEVANATILGVKNENEVSAAMLAYLRDRFASPEPYNLEYGARTGRPGEHEVALRTADDRVIARSTYVLPEHPEMPPELCGLYLTVKVAGETVTRTLAGYAAESPPNTPATPEMVNETLGACFGEIALSFEGAAPSLSIWLDDMLTAKLSAEDLHRSVQSGSFDDLVAAASRGLAHLPPEFFLQTTALPNRTTPSSLTFENGPRVILHKAFAVFDSDRAIRQVDLLPFTHFATAAVDPHEAFRITLEQTARFAVAEAALFPTSTLSLLKDVPLVDGRTLFQNPAVPPEQRNSWRALLNHYPGQDLKLMPASGAPRAFWNIDHRGGGLLGALSDGSGGGRAEAQIEEHLRRFDELMSRYNLLLIGAGAALTPVGGFALGVAGAYGQLLVRLYAAASLAITIMDASGINDAARAALRTFVCNVVKSIFLGAFGKMGTAFDGLDNLIGALGGENNPFSCP